MRKPKRYSARSGGRATAVSRSAPNAVAPSPMTAAGRTGRPAGAAKPSLNSFSVTSGTLFHSRKKPLRSYLMAIAIFANEVKGKSMLAMARDLGVAYQTSFILAHKMREAMASEMKGAHIGGEG